MSSVQILLFFHEQGIRFEGSWTILSVVLLDNKHVCHAKHSVITLYICPLHPNFCISPIIFIYETHKSLCKQNGKY